MAQLSDDAFAFGAPLLPLDEALDLLRQRVAPVTGAETVSLVQAAGRVLDEDLAATISVPSFDNSAVDGYAVRHGDLAAQGPTCLPISSRLPAGSGSVAPIAPGTVVRIFTGAPMPAGADTVFMQEDVRLEAGGVVLPAGLKVGANRRSAGEDFHAGRIALARCTRLDARGIAVHAALGLREARVRRRLKVALFSTGDEIIAPGLPLPPGGQYDSNRALLGALLAARGAAVSDLGILADNRAAIIRALADAAESHDMILTSGGVSTGEEDHVKAAVEALGRLDFWRLALKPGRPVAMGAIRGAAFVGLPGNPVASFVTFVRFAGPLADHLSGGIMRLPQGFPVTADFRYAKKPGRREYVRASLVETEAGPRLRKFPREGAALLSSLAETDGLVELSEETTDIAPGAIVRFLPYALLM